jgi:hypothetical protein
MLEQNSALSSKYLDHIYYRIMAYTVPLAQICLCGSCYSTLALSVER